MASSQKENELGKLTGPNNQKRERADEEQKLYTDDEDDIYKANNIAYEDVVGGEDWNPVEEKIESQTQEEARDSKENADKTEQINDEMKRSGQLGLQDEDLRKENKDQLSDDVSKYNREKVLSRLPYGPGRSKANQLPKAVWMPDVENRQMAYENLNDKDQELGEYLARMLVKYPEIMNANPVKRVPSQGSTEDDRQDENQIEQALKEHLSQHSSQETDKLASLKPSLDHQYPLCRQRSTPQACGRLRAAAGRV
ncbi:SCG2 [Cervus elaphus hippelaphus]|uniref:Secretogranin-2 n=1 Tax=Cervus elaphus hippelaphus TaxID=46360 RepID=A0A212D3R1_CEREH|nr:SCG2 [Cervus elaphus hippelaphus]